MSKVKGNGTMAGLFRILLFLAVSFVLSIAVHEAVHVYQAWRSPTVKIVGIDTSILTGGCCIGVKFAPEDEGIVGFVEESKDWERDAYSAQGVSFLLAFVGLVYGYARWVS